jgi:hypothetical protein
MRSIHEDEMADYRQQEAEERYARKHGIRCTCMYMPLKDCPVHDPISDEEEVNEDE